MFGSIELIIIILTLTFAGFAKGISGFGLPIISIPIFTLMIDLQQSVAIIILTSVFIDLLMAYNKREFYRVQKQRMYTLCIFGIIGTALGTYLLVNLNESILQMVLAAIIFVFVLSNIFNLLPQFRNSPPFWSDVLIGIIAGGFQGSTGSSGPTISMYLMQIKMNRHAFLFLISIFFTIVGLAQVMTLYVFGFYTIQVAFLGLLAIIPSSLGFVAANKVQQFISVKMFRMIILCLIGTSGVLLVYKSAPNLF